MNAVEEKIFNYLEKLENEIYALEKERGILCKSKYRTINGIRDRFQQNKNNQSYFNEIILGSISMLEERLRIVYTKTEIKCAKYVEISITNLFNSAEGNTEITAISLNMGHNNTKHIHLGTATLIQYEE